MANLRRQEEGSQTSLLHTLLGLVLIALGGVGAYFIGRAMIDLLKDLPNLPTGVPAFLTDPAWLAVNLATLALVPQAVGLGRRLWKRWRAPYVPRTQVQKDRENYASLLQQYESNLDLLENLIILRAQHKAGPDPWTPELERGFVETRDGIYRNLERRGKKEKDMGIFQKLDVLEGRLVSIGDTRKKRVELQARQAEIENHPLFIKRSEA